MTRPKRSGIPSLALAWTILAAPALPAVSFPELLARFAEVSPRTSLDRRPSSGSGGEAPLLSIQEFETFFLAPGHALAATRPALRSLDEWPEEIAKYREFVTHGRGPDGMRLEFEPLCRLKLGGNLLLALRCVAIESWVDAGDEVKASVYLFSFAPSGRMIDGLQCRRESRPEYKGFPVGGPNLDYASLIVDEPGRIMAVDRIETNGVLGELWTWEIGLSSGGSFSERPEKRRFLLSSIYAESDDSESRLFVLEPEGQQLGSPLYVLWSNGKRGVTTLAQSDAGISAMGSLAAQDAEGRGMKIEFSTDRGSARLSDITGVEHELRIAYGPGRNRELTMFSKVMYTGSIYMPSSATLSYLFAETLLPVAGADARTRFASGSFVLGPGVKGNGGSAIDSASLGFIAESRDGIVGYRTATFRPGSLRDFEANRVVDGVLARDLTVDTGAGNATLPAGTRVGEMLYPTDRWWAALSKETLLPILKQKLKAAAGSSVVFFPGGSIESIALSAPAVLRIGSADASIYGVELGALYPQQFSEIRLAAPFAATIAGKKVVLTDRLRFDEEGYLSGGRLAEDAELGVGSATLGFRGGYDPDRPEYGFIAFYRNGKPQSGTLAKATVLRTSKATFSLAAGDKVFFRQDGSLESLGPSAMVTMSAGGKKVAFQTLLFSIAPDGSPSLDRSLGPEDAFPEWLKAPSGPISVSTLIAACDGTRVRVRARGSLEAEVLGFLDKGDAVAVLEKGEAPMQIDGASDYWYLIRRISDGLFGWSYGLYLKMDR